MMTSNVPTAVAVAFVLAVLTTTVKAQENFKCPDDFGFYPHHTSCDKYWKCDNNAAELKTCGNGLAFDASDPKFLTENCDYIHNVDCGDRNQLEQCYLGSSNCETRHLRLSCLVQKKKLVSGSCPGGGKAEPPIPAPHCERLYGIFPDEAKCDVFWNCWNGEASRYQCSPGLAYDREARVCMWADQVPECKTEEVAGGFSCPAQAGESATSGSFSRHAHPEDCRKYYICLAGQAREYGCPIGTVFKIGDADGTGNCEDPEDVPGCEDYYGDLDLKSIRKSELLAGLASSDGGKNKASNNSNTPKKPRPAPASRNAPEPAGN